MIIALLGHRVAKILRIPGSKVKLHRDLALLYGRLGEQDIENEYLTSLLKAIVAKSSDVEIWKLVLQYVDSVKPVDPTESRRPTTPPPSLPSFQGSPRMSNSSSYDGFEETAALLEDPLTEEFKNCSYKDVEGFFEKYFEGKSWSKEWEAVYDAIKSEYVDGRWSTIPSPLTERTFWDWLSNLQETHLKSSICTYCTTKSKKEMAKTSGEGQLDVFTTKPEHVNEMPHSWANVLVVGEYTSSKTESKFLQMARYARNVFIDRPRRLFLLGFTLNDSEMALHMFDRSGALCSKSFDIHKEPQRLIQLLVGCGHLSDQELGFDTFVDRIGGRDFISMPMEKHGKRKRLEMETDPIFLQRTAVGRGTSCYRTKDKKAVVKFSWPSVQKSLTEPNFSLQASERKVKGVVKLVGFQEFSKTSDLRAGLNFHKRRRLKGRDEDVKGRTAGSTSSSFASTSTNGKRKSFHEDSPSSKRSRQNSQASGLSRNIQATDLDEEEGKDSQTVWQRPDAQKPDVQKTNIRNSDQGAGFVDRVLSCLLLKPAGRPLSEFSTIPEFLRAQRDSIKGHRSLLLDGRILHRDISPNNIIITDPAEAD